MMITYHKSNITEPVKELTTIFGELIKANERIFQNYFKNFLSSQHDSNDIIKSYTYFTIKVVTDPIEFVKFNTNYLLLLDKQQKLTIDTINNKSDKSSETLIEPTGEDRRFKAPEWNEQPYKYIKQSYLLVSEFLRSVINDSETEQKKKRKLLFYTNQYIDAFSPSNFIFTNPEVIKLTEKTNGENLKQGFRNMLADIIKGSITQTDETAFEVGKNLAVTKGEVIFQNELIQLIQYYPAGKEIYELPLLIIPPWINKYYILDLQPENSFIHYLIGKGFTVFIISWKNPSISMRNISFDDYVKGTLKAVEVIREITGAKKINTLGYCLGGTLLGVTLAVMSSKEVVPVASATFLAAMLDFSDIGPMGDVIDQALVNKLERGELQEKGVMHGHDMEKAFNLIRANDLIWKYVINNYLKGKKPEAFDVLYWTNDNTNLPAKMFAYYLRHMLLGNKLRKKNVLKICDEQIDLGKIDVPAFVIAMKEDHISPPATAFKTTCLLNNPVQFILGDSGHVMGVANPPSVRKYGYNKDGVLGHGFEAWKKSAKHFDGSWWESWSDWLVTQSGQKIIAPVYPGNEKYKIIESAPGSYVIEKCNICQEHSFKLV